VKKAFSHFDIALNSQNFGTSVDLPVGPRMAVSSYRGHSFAIRLPTVILDYEVVGKSKQESRLATSIRMEVGASNGSHG
jgi:hypothetical protein